MNSALKEYMNRTGLSQSEVARICGIAHSSTVMRDAAAPYVRSGERARLYHLKLGIALHCLLGINRRARNRRTSTRRKSQRRKDEAA